MYKYVYVYIHTYSSNQTNQTWHTDLSYHPVQVESSKHVQQVSYQFLHHFGLGKRLGKRLGITLDISLSLSPILFVFVVVVGAKSLQHPRCFTCVIKSMLVWGWLIDSWRNGCWCCAERKVCKIPSLGLPVEFWQRQANVSQMSKWTKSTISDFWTQPSSGGSLCRRLMPWHPGHRKFSIWTQIAVSCLSELFAILSFCFW